MTRERRAIKQNVARIECRKGANGPELVGYASVFNRYSQNLGGFVEEVAPGAFTDTLTRANVAGLFNHDVNQLLATVDSGTLTLEQDATGLRYVMALDVEDPDAVRVMRKVETQKLRGSSFSFRTLDEEWSATEQGFPLRRLLAVELYDVGPVTNPAYLSTEEAGAQVALRCLATKLDLPEARVLSATPDELRLLIAGEEPPAGPPHEMQGPTGAAARAARLAELRFGLDDHERALAGLR